MPMGYDHDALGSSSPLRHPRELDSALMAPAESFPERLDVQPIHRQSYVVAVPVGHRSRP